MVMGGRSISMWLLVVDSGTQWWWTVVVMMDGRGWWCDLISLNFRFAPYDLVTLMVLPQTFKNSQFTP
ncbi:hypothetical protein Hanom_Chr17g01528241 [Helianthus anomalus]